VTEVSTYRGFSFTLNPDLNGTIGGGPGDGDLSDDGRIDISADFPVESGITESEVLLSSLTVVAPGIGGTYEVNLQIDQANSIAGGTFLLIDKSPLTPFSAIDFSIIDL